MLEKFLSSSVQTPRCVYRLWRFLQSSQRGLSCLRHRLTEDVQRRTDRVHPLAHKPGAQVHPGLRRSDRSGEERFAVTRPCLSDSLALTLHVSPQREAKLELLREAVDAYSELTAQVNASRSCFPQLLAWSGVSVGDVFLLVPLRLWEDTASTATCWGSSCRPSRKDSAFPKSSWTRLTAWPRTGSCGQDRSVLTQLDDACRFKCFHFNQRVGVWYFYFSLIRLGKIQLQGCLIYHQSHIFFWISFL